MLPLVWTLWIGTAVASSACEAPTTVAELDEARGRLLEAWVALDEDGVAAAGADADAALVCLEEALTPHGAARYFQVRGLAAFLAEDDVGARDAFRAAVAIRPRDTLPEHIAAPGDAWYEVYEAMRRLPAEARSPLPPAADGWLQVDGVRATDAPVGRMWLLQHLGDDGTVHSTGRVDPDGVPPAYPAAPEPEPEPAAALPPAPEPVRAPTSRTLLLTAAASGAVGLAGLGSAAALKAQYRNTPPPQDASGLKAPNAVLGGVGWAGAGAAAGLAVGAVVVGRW